MGVACLPMHVNVRVCVCNPQSCEIIMCTSLRCEKGHWLTSELFPEEHECVLALLPHEAGRQPVASAQVLVAYRRGAVPGVVVAYPRVASLGTAYHQVCTVHGVQGCSRKISSIARYSHHCDRKISSIARYSHHCDRKISSVARYSHHCNRKISS